MNNNSKYIKILSFQSQIKTLHILKFKYVLKNFLKNSFAWVKFFYLTILSIQLIFYLFFIVSPILFLSFSIFFVSFNLIFIKVYNQ